MITLEMLKENRNEIIEYLTDELGAEYVKEGMNIVVSMIGFRGYESLPVMSFVKTAIKDNGIADRIIMAKGAIASRNIEARNIEMAKRQMKNI